jgi:pyroglutamyl-peptidase
MVRRSGGEPRPFLLTGFDPFGGDDSNASWLVARALHGERIEGGRIEAVCLPTAFGTANEALRTAFDRTQPQLVLCLGLGANRSELSLERVAINVVDAQIPDNAGASPVDEPVVAGAPAAYFATLPIKAMVAALHEAGLPAAVSQSAGTFVCNHVFFGLMHLLKRRRRRSVRGGFMHVPLASTLPLPEQARGVRIALATAVTAVTDRSAGGGTIA